MLMVVVAVSLLLTSIGTSRFAPQIPMPREERRRVGEAVLLPAHADDDTLRRVVSLAAKLTEPVGGVVRPLVVITSTEQAAIEEAHERQARTDEILRHAGQDVETQLRIDRSVAAGLNRAAIQADSSMLLMPWPGPENVRSWLLGANYREIIAATALPIVIAALQADPRTVEGRLVLLARDTDLVPGNLPSLHLGADIASMLMRRKDKLIVGPLPPDAITGSGIGLPDQITHCEGNDDIAAFVAEHTSPGDVVIIPVRDGEIRSQLIEVFDTGRSVLAVTHNPESQPSLAGSTMTLPVGGSIFPA